MKMLLRTLVLGGVTLLSGCLYVNKQDVTESGIKVESSQLGKLELNKTTYKEAVAVLGAGTHSSKSGKRTEVIYEFEQISTGNTGLIFIFLDEKSTVKKESVTLVFDDGILVDYYSK